MSSYLLRKLSHYMDLTDGEKQLLNNPAMDRVTIRKGQDLIREGQRPDYVYLIEEGWACRYKLLEDGTQHIMAYLIPGDLCDVHVTILDQMDHSIRALTPLKIALYPAEEISRIMESSIRLSKALFWSTLVDEAILREWLVNAGSRPADVRLAHVFCELLIRSRAAGLTQSNTFVLPITQAELGETMGLSNVHVNRVLQKLRQEGLISTDGKQMTILDWERMEQFAQFNPNYLHCQYRPC